LGAKQPQPRIEHLTHKRHPVFVVSCQDKSNQCAFICIYGIRAWTFWCL